MEEFEMYNMTQWDLVSEGREGHRKAQYREEKAQETKIMVSFEKAKKMVPPLAATRKALDAFIRHSEMAMRKVHPSKQYCLLQHIIARVRKDIDLDLEHLSEQTWLDVKIALLEHLDIHESETEARKALFSAERAPGDPFATNFGYSLKSKVDHYVEVMRRNRRSQDYITLRQFIANEHARDLFIEELSIPFREYLIGEEPETLEEAIGILGIYFEEYDYEFEEKKYPEHLRNKEYKLLKVGQKQPEPPVAKPKKNPAGPDEICKLCEGPGHQGLNRKAAQAVLSEHEMKKVVPEEAAAAIAAKYKKATEKSGQDTPEVVPEEPETSEKKKKKKKKKNRNKGNQEENSSPEETPGDVKESGSSSVSLEQPKKSEIKPKPEEKSKEAEKDPIPAPADESEKKRKKLIKKNHIKENQSIKASAVAEARKAIKAALRETWPLLAKNEKKPGSRRYKFKQCLEEARAAKAQREAAAAENPEEPVEAAEVTPVAVVVNESSHESDQEDEKENTAPTQAKKKSKKKKKKSKKNKK